MPQRAATRQQDNVRDISQRFIDGVVDARLALLATRTAAAIGKPRLPLRLAAAAAPDTAAAGRPQGKHLPIHEKLPRAQMIHSWVPSSEAIDIVEALQVDGCALRCSYVHREQLLGASLFTTGLLKLEPPHQ